MMDNRVTKKDLKLIHCQQDFQQVAPGVATIGNFDALHRGHQQLLKQVLIKAKTLKLAPTVVTFEPLPAVYLQPDKPFFRLLSLRQKIQYLQQLGFKQVVCLRFNQQLMQLSPQEFFQSYLIAGLKVKCLLVGENFRFGYGKIGNIDTLQTLGQKYHCEIMSIPLEKIGDSPVSSTRIRQALQSGELEQVKSMLGRYYSLAGKIIKGSQQGRQMGFPTANLPLKNPPLVKGVFIVAVFFTAEYQTHYGLMNIGTRPTLDGKNYQAEVHILAFNQNIYGQRVEVSLLHKLRDEIRFADVERLRQQISQDVEQAKVWLAQTQGYVSRNRLD